MLDKVVLDSSAIVALFFKEKYSDWVEKIVAKASELLTVDLAIAEVTNAAWKRVFIFSESQKVVRDALENAINFILNVCHVFSSVELYKDAFEDSLKLKIPVYDTLFLSLARRLKCGLVTLDKKFIKKIYTTKYAQFIIHPYSVKELKQD